MLTIREAALLTCIITLTFTGCSGDKKDDGGSGSNNDCQSQQNQQQQQQQTQQQGQFGSQTQQGQFGGQTQTQTGGTGTGNTAGGQSFGLVAGELFTMIKNECVRCHNGQGANGTATDSNFNDATVVTSKGAMILQRVQLPATDELFMPQDATTPVTFLAELQAWQTAGFTDIATYDPSATGTGTALPQPTINPSANGTFGNSNQFGNNQNCQTTAQGTATSNGGFTAGSANQAPATTGNTGGFGTAGNTGTTGTATGTATGGATGGATTSTGGNTTL